MGTRRERQRQGQSDQKRPQDPEKGGHSRPAGRRQRQETEITVPEGTPGSIFSSVRPYTPRNAVADYLQPRFVWRKERKQNLSQNPPNISLLYFDLNLSTPNSPQPICIFLPCVALG